MTVLWRFARHEWKLVFKEPRFLLPFLAGPLLLIGVQVFAVFIQPMGDADENWRLARALLLMLSVLACGVAVPLSADSFAGERERNTLELLLCLPIAPGALFAGKVLGVLPFPVLFGWLGQAAILGVLGWKGLLLREYWPQAVKALVLTPFMAIFLCSLTVLISLKSESVRGATQVSGLAMLGLFLCVTVGSKILLVSDGGYSIFAAFLIGGSAICFYSAKKRFLRLP